MQKISKRLKAITKYISPYKTLADVGTDHAYLIVYALKEGLIQTAQAIDNKIGPLESAKMNCEKNGVKDKVDFTLSNGLKDLNEKMEVVVIAGMGGNTIQEILKESLEAAKTVQRIIVQANTQVPALRRFLDETGFKIEQEEILEEKNKIYEILQVSYTGKTHTLSEIDYVFGPKLRVEKSVVFLKHTHKRYKEKVKQYTHVKIDIEKKAIQNELKLYKEVLSI